MSILGNTQKSGSYLFRKWAVLEWFLQNICWAFFKVIQPLNWLLFLCSMQVRWAKWSVKVMRHTERWNTFQNWLWDEWCCISLWPTLFQLQSHSKLPYAPRIHFVCVCVCVWLYTYSRFPWGRYITSFSRCVQLCSHLTSPSFSQVLPVRWLENIEELM